MDEVEANEQENNFPDEEEINRREHKLQWWFYIGVKENIITFKFLNFAAP